MLLVEKKEIVYAVCIYILITPHMKKDSERYGDIYTYLKSKLDAYKKKIPAKEYLDLVYKTSELMGSIIEAKKMYDIVPKDINNSKFKLYTVLGMIKLNDLYVWNKLGLQSYMDQLDVTTVKNYSSDEWLISRYNMRFMLEFIIRSDEFLC